MSVFGEQSRLDMLNMSSSGCDPLHTLVFSKKLALQNGRPAVAAFRGTRMSRCGAD
jgi:hypothetical protein